MKLILIYGSPAVGKLTTANAIAERTDFKVFHNHLTISAVRPVFEFGTEPFWKLVHMFRVETIAEAARQGQNLIYTFCYAKDTDDAHVAEVARVVGENGGELCLVLLVAEKKMIRQRVTEESRIEFHKVGTVETLERLWSEYEMFSPVNDRESLIIDNTKISAEDAARKIVEYFEI